MTMLDKRKQNNKEYRSEIVRIVKTTSKDLVRPLDYSYDTTLLTTHNREGEKDFI